MLFTSLFPLKKSFRQPPQQGSPAQGLLPDGLDQTQQFGKGPSRNGRENKAGLSKNAPWNSHKTHNWFYQVTKKELSKHNRRDDCWMAINGILNSNLLFNFFNYTGDINRQGVQRVLVHGLPPGGVGRADEGRWQRCNWSVQRGPQMGQLRVDAQGMSGRKAGEWGRVAATFRKEGRKRAALFRKLDKSSGAFSLFKKEK